MESIQIIGNGLYLPALKINNTELEKKFNVEEGYILKRTGINIRYYKKDEDICKMALKASKVAIEKAEIVANCIDLIIVATTSTNVLMPGISYYIQKELKIETCMCLDILAGCAGYINALDIAKLYIDSKKINTALIIGVDVLSECTNENDINTKIILSDGAGATIVKRIEEFKLYSSNIQSDGKNGDILTYKINEKIKMDGKAIYKYAVTETVNNIEELLKRDSIKLEDVKYIIPHQSNIKIIKSIATKLNVSMDKVYTNINKIGNTFCASIPIALTQMYEDNLLKDGDKVILIGYGGGLNTASILLEI